MNEILPNIKDRVLQFAENKEDNKQIFFRKTGLKYSNFTGKSKNSDLNSKSVAEILLTYPEINLKWLLTGKGEMLKQEVTINTEKTNSYKDRYLEVLEENRLLYKENKALQEDLVHLNNLLDDMRYKDFITNEIDTNELRKTSEERRKTLKNMSYKDDPLKKYIEEYNESLLNHTKNTGT